MKICPKCGNRNFYNVGDKIECQKCGTDLDEKSPKHHPINMGSGCSVTKKKLLHDEMPWDFTHND